MDAHPSGDHPISPALPELRIMGILVQDRTIYGAVILCPLVFNVNEGPSTSAKLEML